MPAQAAEVTLQGEAAWACLVDDVQAMTSADQTAQRLRHRLDAAADCREMAYVDVARSLGQRDVDAVLVNVQTDVQSDRLTHGPSP